MHYCDHFTKHTQFVTLSNMQQTHTHVTLNRPGTVDAISRLLDFISCSMTLLVMPHSATSSVSGDDTSTNVTWNSGVMDIHCNMWVNKLLQDTSQTLVTPGHLLAPSSADGRRRTRWSARWSARSIAQTQRKQPRS
jgi:hypothetical protein